MENVKMSEKVHEIVEISDLKDMLNKSATQYKNNIAFKFRETPNGKIAERTYEEFKKDVDSLGTALINLGLKGKKIAVIGNNSYEWCVAYMAVVCGTGIVVPIDKALPKGEIENLLKISECEAVLFEYKYEEVMSEIKEKNNTIIKHYINFIESMQSLIKSGNELINKGEKSFVDAKIDNKAVSSLLFTSGTTSLSKAVMLSQYNICSNIMSVSSVLKYYPNDTLLSFLPIHHTLENTATFLTGIYSGACLGMCEGIRYISQNLIDYKVSVFIAVPLVLENIYKKIVNLPEPKKALGGYLRVALVGAAPLNKDVIIGLNNLGIRTCQGYGLTETSPVLTVENDKYACPGSIGYTLPGVEVKIVDGEIVAKGPNVMMGYYNNKEATDEVLKDGWFYTGDLGYVDENGFLFITGRKKNVIVLKNGKNIFPEEIEVLINGSQYVTESFVYAKAAKDGDSKICAKIVINNEENKTEDEINEIITKHIKEVNKKLPLYKYVREFSLTNEGLAKTTTGKIKRYEEMKKI